MSIYNTGMNNTLKWILGCAGVLTAIVGILLTVWGLKYVKNKRSIARKYRITKEKYVMYKSLSKDIDVELSKLYAGQRNLYGSDDSLDAVALSNRKLYKMNVEIKLLERKFMLENRIYADDFAKPFRFIEMEGLNNKDLMKTSITRIRQLSRMESKISKLKVDVDTIEYLNEKKTGGSLDTLGQDMEKLDHRIISSDKSYH